MFQSLEIISEKIYLSSGSISKVAALTVIPAIAQILISLDLKHPSPSAQHLIKQQ